MALARQARKLILKRFHYTQKQIFIFILEQQIQIIHKRSLAKLIPILKLDFVYNILFKCKYGIPVIDFKDCKGKST